MTTPPEPHMVVHTGMSLVTELLTIPVVLFPGPTQLHGKQVTKRWLGTGNKAVAE